MNPNNADKIDMDSVLSNIMRGGPNLPSSEPQPSMAQPQPRPQIRPVTQQIRPTPVPEPVMSKEEPIAFPLPQNEKRSNGFKKRYVIMPLLIIGLGLGGFFLKQPIASLMAPPSPFSAELIQNIGFPLYYPTKLPAGFKFELNSVQSGNGVVVYNISNEENKVISVSLQVQPDGLTLDTAIQSLKAQTKSRKLTTSIGEASVGISKEESLLISNVLTGKTWILINTAENTIIDSDIDLLLNSFKQAE